MKVTDTIASDVDSLVAEVADRFTEEARQGLSPSIEQYAEQHPQIAAVIRQVFPALAVMSGFDASAMLGSAGGSQVAGSAVGQIGDFRIIREIGRGGMGIVYEAEQVSIGRPVALKVLPFAAMLDDGRLARFRNEVRAAGQLHHTNIVPVYSVGSERGVHYYAMQLVEGQSLAQAIEQLRVSTTQQIPRGDESAPPASTSCDPPDTAPIAALSTLRGGYLLGGSQLPVFTSREFYCTIARLGIQASEALEHAHSCGVIHRDIKPSNLLVDTRGCLWITDFGLARIDNETELTITGDLLGTLRYMSPEQTRGSRVVLDGRTDIYSLGVTLYELLTLQPAFTADDRPALLRAINDEEPRAPRRINPAIPADLETIVLKAMTKEAAGRYASAQDLAADLRRFLEHKPIEARRPSLMERAGKWARRHAALVAISAAALSVVTLACLAAALFTLHAYRLEAQHRMAAVDNLKVASESIDRMLARVSEDQYFHGDLSRAMILAADATEFYEKLLTHSDDPELRFRAAKAHQNVADIWYLVGQHEKARAAALRSLELLRPLIAAVPAAKYLNVRGGAYLSLGRAEGGLQRFYSAEEPWQLAAADYQYLIEHYPREPKYRGSLANTLGDLGLLYWTRSQLDEAEKSYKRSIEIRDSLPESVANTAEYLTAKAMTFSNWAMVARERGDTRQALDLLDQANALQKRSLDQWPNDPEAIDSLFSQFWHISETAVRASDHRSAARAVEALVFAFPDRLKGYHYGAEQLLKCAALADKEAADASAAPEPPDAGSSEQMKTSWEAKTKSPAEGYRERARELVARAHTASDRTPDSIQEFAWFLVTCKDESFHDPEKSLKLAQAVLDEIPDRGQAWLTLALAQYRLGDWPAADDALQKSTQYPRGGGSRICEWLVLAMLRHQQGRADEARQWHEKASNWFEKHTTDFEYVYTLHEEADALLAQEPPSSKE